LKVEMKLDAIGCDSVGGPHFGKDICASDDRSTNDPFTLHSEAAK
jgi:hypothetical protein